MTDVGLYVHIPFCEAKCHYCDFVTFTDKNPQIDSYLAALACEIATYKSRSLKTIFIGGGTPTVLSLPQINVLFSSLRDNFDWSLLSEATVEANPESATPDKLTKFLEYGINRLSLGLQSTQNELLETLGRLHNAEKFFNVYGAARKLGFKNINVDLMFGLPGQTLMGWDKTLDDILSIKPEHISAYSLKIETGTDFWRAGMTLNHDLQADMYLLASEKLARQGYSHYEISNFSLPAYESEHNLRYWKNEDTIGVGVSSASFLSGKRTKNTSAFKSYLDDCLNGKLPSRTEVVLDESERSKETIMLELRLNTGTDAQKLGEQKIPLVDVFLQKGLARINDGRYSLTPKGWLLSNQLFQYFVS